MWSLLWLSHTEGESSVLMCVKRHRAVCLNAVETGLWVTAWTPVSGGNSPKGQLPLPPSNSSQACWEERVATFRETKGCFWEMKSSCSQTNRSWKSHALIRARLSRKRRTSYLSGDLLEKKRKKKDPLKYCLLPRGKDIFLDWIPEDVGLNKDVRTNSALLWDYLFAKNQESLRSV